ncbi:SEC-C metal-binding domain-containing protein [Povalibacter uvarum]
MRHGQHFAILSARPLFGDNPNSPYLVAAGPRLEMCTCKSGRRFKHCHGRAEAPTKSLASWSYPTLVITENDEGNWLISVEPAPLT